MTATALEVADPEVQLVVHNLNDPVRHPMAPAYRDPEPGSLPEGVSVRVHLSQRDPLLSSCPWRACKSPPGEQCRTRSGNECKPHKWRVKRALADHDAGVIRSMPNYNSGAIWYIRGGTATTLAGQGGHIIMTPASTRGTAGGGVVWDHWQTIYTEQILWRQDYAGQTYTTNGWITPQVWYDWSTSTTIESTGYKIDMPAEEWNRLGIQVMRSAITKQRKELDGPARQARLDREQAEREAISRRRLAAAQKHDQAQGRAMELLAMVLTEREKLAWNASDKSYILIAAPSGQLYKVYTGNSVHGNVLMTDEHGCHLASLCVQPTMYHERGAMPLADGWIGQVLHIKHNEQHLLETANISRRSECRFPGVPILGRTRTLDIDTATQEELEAAVDAVAG